VSTFSQNPDDASLQQKISRFCFIEAQNDSPKKRKRHEELAGDFAGDLAEDIEAQII
jgi:hypothetical protein